jgi:SAM-dependent methyltransferase
MRAEQEFLNNVSFQTASVYDLPFAAGRFEVVFAHAIIQHLSDPEQAIREMCRVLVPGGIIALRSPDWGARLVTPRDTALEAAFDIFLDEYYAQGDAFAGRNGPALLRGAGCRSVIFTTTVEHEKPADLGPFAAAKLRTPKQEKAAGCLQTWAANPDALFAQMWGETIGRRADNMDQTSAPAK